MPPKQMPPPAPLRTVLKTYVPNAPKNLRKLEEATLGRLNYMASRMRAILTSFAARKDYNHEWWIANIDYEMVSLFFFEFY
jgi:hypothetical protein